MRTFRLVMIAAVLTCGTSAMAGDIAPGGTLRATYLGTNPAQAMRDPATGEVRGPAYDLARELARRNNEPLSRISDERGILALSLANPSLGSAGAIAREIIGRVGRGA